VGAFSGVENAKMWGPSPEMPKTGSPLAKGELHIIVFQGGDDGRGYRNVRKIPRGALELWLGWAYLTKAVREPQRRGINFDPPMVFCACSIICKIL
jgi:hypothetical protein